MSEPFPTKADIEFFSSEKAKRIQELWEKRRPRTGDYYWDNEDGEVHLIGSFSQAGRIREWFSCSWSGFIWLPLQGQLQAMLEDRGRFLMFRGPYMMPERRYQVTAMAEDLDRLDARIDAFGPTPSIALGKALIEVLGE